MSAVVWILENKLLTTLIIVCGSLFISTTVLAVQKSELIDKFDECEANLKTTTAAPTTTTDMPPTTEGPDLTKYRLPKEVKPISYDLTLKPHLDTKLFSGEVKIKVNVLEDVTEVILNSHTLNIDSVKIGAADLENELDIEYERLLIRRPDGFKKGEHEFTIAYNGNMTSKLVGLYHSTFKIGTGEEKSIATTKFEPTYARQAYPCFDEPNLKATYKVHLLKPAGDEFIALSNMPEDAQVPPTVTPEGTIVHFETSAKMSTYLVCFIVSTMKHTESSFGGGADAKPLRVFATPGQEAKTDYALKTAVKIMNYYLDYFDIPYPLPKLDMVAIPDFVSGAMENWGLVTYRETALLFDELTSSAANKARIAEVIAHELAHSWFGNLVTMDWWDDLWLNEGFASYIEYKGVNEAEPLWEMMDQFLIADLHDVFILDATTASHPIVQKAETPDQITAMFDTISYKKGASILRMLEDSITPAKFKLGVTNYLKNNEWGNAVTAAFWKEMTGVVEDLDISGIMATWTTQMGYPLVTVTKAGSKYTLKQERYLTNSAVSDNKADYKWTIPITYITDKTTGNPTERKLVWFNKEQNQLEIEIPDATWAKFNFHQVGYYRVNYPEADWKEFANLLATELSVFDVSDRAHLLEESFRLAESGHISYKIALDLSKYLEFENNFVCWSVASNVLGQLKTYLFNYASNEDYQMYVANLLKTIVATVGWDEKPAETDLQKRLRALVLSLSCSMGNEECLEEARSKFTAWLEGSSDAAQLNQNLRAIIYNYGIQRATKVDWHKVFEKFKSEADANERSRLLDALSRVKDPELLQSLILFAQDPKNIKNQDYFNCMALISANPSGTGLVWNYVRANWEAIVGRFGLNERNLGRMIPAITKTFSTEISLAEMKTFFDNNPYAGAGELARLEAIETVQNNIKWVDKNEEVVSDWIAANKK